MSKECRGIACIINVFHTESDGQPVPDRCGQPVSDRCGTNVDRDRLKQLFEQLHFHVKIFNDDDGLSAEVS